MVYEDYIAITGVVDEKYIVLYMNLKDGFEYECKKILFFNDLEKKSIHSIYYINNAMYMIDSFNNKIYKYNFLINEFNEVTVGRDPRHMCIDNNNIYVTNFESDNISVIDLQNYSLEGSIPAGIKPHDIKFSIKRNSLFFSCYEENQIIECNLYNYDLKYINTDGKPMHVFLDENNIIALTYFVNGNIYSKINFIDIENNQIEKVIKIKGLITDADYDQLKKMLYIINIEDKSLYIIDVNKMEIIKKIYLGGYPESISFGEENIYITNSKKKQIIIIDIVTLSVSKCINLQFKPECIKTICKF